MHKDTTYQGSDRQDFYRHGKKKKKKKEKEKKEKKENKQTKRRPRLGLPIGNPVTRCFREAYTGLPVVRAAENQKALNCVVLKYSIPVSEE